MCAEPLSEGGRIGEEKNRVVGRWSQVQSVKGVTARSTQRTNALVKQMSISRGTLLRQIRANQVCGFRELLGGSLNSVSTLCIAAWIV